MSQNPLLASAKWYSFVVVCQAHQMRPPLVFKVKDLGSCNIPSRILYPFMAFSQILPVSKLGYGQKSMPFSTGRLWKWWWVSGSRNRQTQRQDRQSSGRREHVPKSFTGTKIQIVFLLQPLQDILSFSQGIYTVESDQCHHNPWICHFSCLRGGSHISSGSIQGKEREGFENRHWNEKEFTGSSSGKVKIGKQLWQGPGKEKEQIFPHHATKFHPFLSWIGCTKCLLLTGNYRAGKMRFLFGCVFFNGSFSGCVQKLLALLCCQGHRVLWGLRKMKRMLWRIG